MLQSYITAAKCAAGSGFSRRIRDNDKILTAAPYIIALFTSDLGQPLIRQRNDDLLRYHFHY